MKKNLEINQKWLIFDNEAKKFIFERKFLLLNIILSIYVATNLIGGERGLIAYFNKKNIEDLKVMQKRELIKNLNDIEKKMF